MNTSIFWKKRQKNDNDDVNDDERDDDDDDNGTEIYWKSKMVSTNFSVKTALSAIRKKIIQQRMRIKYR